MNVKEYIASGIVESYVLGLASADEMAEFERMCAAHQEVRLAREAFEKQLEQHAIENGINPPIHLQSKIFAELEVEADKLRSNTIVADPREVEHAAPVTITMQWWKYAAVASVILLVGSIALNVYYANRARNYQDLYFASQTEIAKSKDMQVQLTAYERSLEILRDTNMAVVRMKGMPQHPESMATIYWDKRSKDVYLFVNNLPEPEVGKQYQLWALVNGQPVDAGMLHWDDRHGVAAMKNIQRAQGFAITLEKEGGSPTPNTEAMYVMGTM